MIRHVRRYLAIRSYMLRLSRELMCRFGKQRHYPLEHVTQAVQRSDLSATFIAYAHAAFCTQADFDTHYDPLGVSCTYQGLRSTIARRYFSGCLDFDGKSIISRFCYYGDRQNPERMDTQADSDASCGGDSGH